MTKEELCRRVAELENVDLFIVDEMKAYTENLNDALKILAKYRGGVVGSLFGENEILVLDEGTRDWKHWRAFNYRKPEISLKDTGCKFFCFYGSNTVIKDVCFSEFVALGVYDSKITAYLSDESRVHHYNLEINSELSIVNAANLMPNYISVAMNDESKLTFRSNTAPLDDFRLEIEIHTHNAQVDVDITKFRKGKVELMMEGECKGCKINIKAKQPYKSVGLSINGDSGTWENNEIIINGIRQSKREDN